MTREIGARLNILWLDTYDQVDALGGPIKKLYGVVWTVSTQQCLELLSGGGFSLVISEFKYMPTDMPSKEIAGGLNTGAALYQRIREINPTVPVIFYHLSRNDELVAPFTDPGNLVWQYHKRTTTPRLLCGHISRLIGV